MEALRCFEKVVLICYMLNASQYIQMQTSTIKLGSSNMSLWPNLQLRVRQGLRNEVLDA